MALGSLQHPARSLSGGAVRQWVRPGIVRVKWGAGWVDSGYRGDPAAPTGLAVNAWNYDNVSFKWTAGVGGAAISHYQVVINDQTNTINRGTWTGTTAATTSGNLAVADSTKYHAYVRSISTNGLGSDWIGPLKISIGKPAVTTYTTETGTRNWSQAASVNGYKDANVGVAVATNRTVKSVRYQISANAGFTSILSSYNNRQIYRVKNSSIQEIFSWDGSVDTTPSVADYVGSGGITGMRCTGAGWSIYTTGTERAVGTITVSGTETYSYQEPHTTPAVANTYW